MHPCSALPSVLDSAEGWLQPTANVSLFEEVAATAGNAGRRPPKVAAGTCQDLVRHVISVLSWAR